MAPQLSFELLLGATSLASYFYFIGYIGYSEGGHLTEAVRRRPTQ